MRRRTARARVPKREKASAMPGRHCGCSFYGVMGSYGSHGASLNVLLCPVAVNIAAVLQALAAAIEVVRQFEDHIPELEIARPYLVDRIIAEQRAEDVSRDGAGRVAVAAVVDGGDDAGGKIVRVPQGAVDGDGERLLRDPALAEAVDVGEIRLSVVRKPDGEVDARGQLVQMLAAGKEHAHRVARLTHDLQQRLRLLRIDDAVQDVGQDGGRHIAERVPVRDGGELCTFAVERLDGHGSVPADAQRGDAPSDTFGSTECT